MDVSEYDAMRENKRLLEASLKKEREYKKEIDRLNEEKIKALEDAKMKVVKVSRRDTHEHVMITRHQADIYRELQHYFSGERSRRDRFNLYDSATDLEFVNYLLRTFFKKETSFSIYSDNETVTTHGLDEIKVELRKDIESKIDKETKDKLERADVAIRRHREIIQEKEELEKELKGLSQKYTKTLDLCDKLTKELDAKEKDDLTINYIEKVLSNGYNFWNAVDKLNNIKDSLRK